jgi:hypothetical protein
LIPRVFASSTLKGIEVGFPVLIVVVAFVLLGVAHMFIGTIVQNAKLQTLATLHQRIGPIDDLGPGDDYKRLLEIYTEVQRSPSLPFSIATLVPYTTALVAPLLTFLLAVAFRHEIAKAQVRGC